MPSLNGVLVFNCLFKWKRFLLMRDGAESHACLVGMESMYSTDYLHGMESLTCVMELKVIHAKMERSQRIQLFSYMDWNHLCPVHE
jgi:hypothetical protein